MANAALQIVKNRGLNTEAEKTAPLKEVEVRHIPKALQKSKP